MSQQIVADLQARLTNFGLNPNEWIVFNVNESACAALSKENPQFVFAGGIQKVERGWDWVDLELVEF